MVADLSSLSLVSAALQLGWTGEALMLSVSGSDVGKQMPCTHRVSEKKTTVYLRRAVRDLLFVGV